MGELSASEILAELEADQRLRGFVRNGRLERLPAKWSRRVQMLNEIVQAFEPGVRYPERQVNSRLAAIHPDYCTLRRYLVDEDLMDRSGGEYWRIGGPALS